MGVLFNSACHCKVVDQSIKAGVSHPSGTSYWPKFYRPLMKTQWHGEAHNILTFTTLLYTHVQPLIDQIIRDSGCMVHVGIEPPLENHLQCWEIKGHVEIIRHSVSRLPCLCKGCSMARLWTIFHIRTRRRLPCWLILLSSGLDAGK